MKCFEVFYGMGGIATGGYFKSLIVAASEENIEAMLCEEHGEDVLITKVNETSQTNGYDHDQILSTTRV
ncbi:hypothetical protein [Paenibacillus campinasensis]|uniref:Uncharacterized protein n=1 Tax=Paenibacillus campinasensis TaxID=66347 RepID=A0A268EI70_9BACL|nr:hypothetical protein [Paenibacillus campinasensis]PAD72821.1 hypothetical protein CHH67_21165 [Paenibacillus campinasensis]